jgi:hypothetical protein
MNVASRDNHAVEDCQSEGQSYGDTCAHAGVRVDINSSAYGADITGVLPR